MPPPGEESAAIFSPSIARIAASAARDWSHVDSWLASKFPPGRPLPSFERNQDTLKALLALATANEAADEQRQLLAHTEASALAENPHRLAPESGLEDHVSRSQLLREDLLASMQRYMTSEGKNALEHLAKMAVQVGTSAEPRHLASHVLDAQSSLFELQQMLAHLGAFERCIERDAEQTDILLRTWKDDCFRAASDSAKQNLDMRREIKSMSAHVDDLRERAASKASFANDVHPTIDDVYLQEKDLLALSARKKEFDTQIATFEGLPYDTDTARAELDDLRCQLQTLSARRDAIFEGLVERERLVQP